MWHCPTYAWFIILLNAYFPFWQGYQSSSWPQTGCGDFDHLSEAYRKHSSHLLCLFHHLWHPGSPGKDALWNILSMHTEETMCYLWCFRRGFCMQLFKGIFVSLINICIFENWGELLLLLAKFANTKTCGRKSPFVCLNLALKKGCEERPSIGL